MNDIHQIEERIKNMDSEQLANMVASTLNAYQQFANLWESFTPKDVRVVEEVLDSKREEEYMKRVEQLRMDIINKDDEIGKLRLAVKASKNPELYKQLGDSCIILTNHIKKLESTLSDKDNLIKSLNEQISDLTNQLNKANKHHEGLLEVKRFTKETGHKYNDVSDDTLIEMYKLGIKVNEIAEKVGMTYHGVRAKLISLGVWVEKPHGGQRKQK